MNTHITIRQYGGGVGATTLALVIGKRLATPDSDVLVISHDSDIYPLAGVADGATDASHAPHIRLMAANGDPFYQYQRDMDIVHRACRYTVCEGIEPPKGFDVAIRFGIVRNDYISLKKAITQHDPEYPVTHWIVREQPNRVLSINDCKRTLPGATDSNMIVMPDLPTLARTCDAGLLLYKKFLDPVIDRIIDDITESEVTYA